MRKGPALALVIALLVLAAWCLLMWGIDRALQSWSDRRRNRGFVIRHVERPDTGTVTGFPKDPRRLLVVGTDGKCYCPLFVQTYTPGVGDTVALIWADGEPIVTGKQGSRG
jgi:hypothetical protein